MLSEGHKMSKQYGSVFTVYFGPKKVVVLAGYQTVKQALVNHAEEFGGRDISPIFYNINKGYGRVQEEIDRVIGDRQLVMKDRKVLPYTDAVIHETQRLAYIAPISLPHATTCDVHFQGFVIKVTSSSSLQGTCVFPLLASVLNDENEWESPNTFNPAHFLDEQGQFVKRDAFMPFSAGRRVCLGESLARMELFLFFTSLLQQFCFTPLPGMSVDQLDLTPAVGVTLNPLPHKLCAVRRI
ncbi:hypothetical protein NFI96_001883 [Prochilodus magdalenae]|nr:hypothetical protein NFI96_001883 [Prochilodus magdalenae]